MKNTNIDWIGNIPNSWEVSKIKHCFYLSKQKARDKNPTILKLARSAVQVRDISTNEGQLAESYENYNPVKVGDLLLNPMDLYSGANCNVSEIEGVISPAYQNLRKKVELNSKYFDYYFKIQYWTMAMFAHGKGISFDNRWTINTETILNYYIPFPSLDVQNCIVNALTKKISQVDELIANQEKQIEKLKEYKQSVITEAVTKGLDKSAPLKDSGIEWIGKIPEEWNVVKARRIISSTQNGLTRRDLNESRGNIVLKLKNISQEGVIDYSYINRIELSDTELNTYELCNGDFLFVRVNGSQGLVGKCAIYSDNGEKTAYNDHIIRVRINSLCVDKFFYFYLYSVAGKTEIEHHTSTSAGQYTISGEGLRDIYLVLPSQEEQERITHYLEKMCDNIKHLIVIKQEKIEKLQEYKKSLIYEYVTGKKEVV